VTIQVSGTALQVEQILEMPMPSRDVFRLVNLVPGAFMVSGMDGGPVSIGGGRGQSAKALLDGVNNSRGATRHELCRACTGRALFCSISC